MKKQTWPVLMALASMAVFNSCKKDGVVPTPSVNNEISSESIEVPPGYVLLGDVIVSEKVHSILKDKNYTPNKGTTVEVVRRWPDGVVPFTVDAGFSSTMKTRIKEAIQDYHDQTNVRFVERTFQTNFVKFRSGAGCTSLLGMNGGEQFITLSNGCSKRAILHEIGHALGLFHEHQRIDRNSHIQVHYANIDNSVLPQSQEAANFDTYNTVAILPNGMDHGPFDFLSTMIYFPTAFALPGKNVLTDLAGNPSWGNNQVLSAGDINALNAMYPTPRFDLNIASSPLTDMHETVHLVGHIGGDSRDDIIAIDYTGTAYGYILQGSNNSPSWGSKYTMYGVNMGSPYSHTYYTGDWDNDGFVDVMSLSSSGALTYFEFNGMYLESKGTPNGYTNCGGSSTEIFVEDWDLDGTPDVMKRCGNVFTLYHNFNASTNTFTVKAAGSIPQASGYAKIVTGDFVDGNRPYLLGFDAGTSETIWEHELTSSLTFFGSRFPMKNDFNFNDVQEFLVGNWSSNHEDIIVLTNSNELVYYEAHREGNFLSEFRRWAPVEDAGWENANDKFYVGNFTNNGTSDIVVEKWANSFQNIFQWAGN